MSVQAESLKVDEDQFKASSASVSRRGGGLPSFGACHTDRGMHCSRRQTDIPFRKSQQFSLQTISLFIGLCRHVRMLKNAPIRAPDVVPERSTAIFLIGA